MFVGHERHIKMERTVLLQKLEETKQKMIEEFEEAQRAWEQAARDFFNDRIERMSTGNFDNLEFMVGAPRNNLKDIDRALGMVSYSVEEFITLDENTFNQWVMGEWAHRDILRNVLANATALSGSLRKV